MLTVWKKAESQFFAEARSFHLQTSLWLQKGSQTAQTFVFFYLERYKFSLDLFSQLFMHSNFDLHHRLELSSSHGAALLSLRLSCKVRLCSSSCPMGVVTVFEYEKAMYRNTFFHRLCFALWVSFPFYALLFPDSLQHKKLLRMRHRACAAVFTKSVLLVCADEHCSAKWYTHKILRRLFRLYLGSAFWTSFPVFSG